MAETDNSTKETPFQKRMRILATISADNNSPKTSYVFKATVPPRKLHQEKWQGSCLK
jgi:hypothetical protein